MNLVRRMPRRVERTELNLTSMMDLFTIILTFLLMSQASTDATVAANSDLQLPLSSADAAVEVAVNVVVTRDQILVDGVAVTPLQAVPDELRPGYTVLDVPQDARQGAYIEPLLSALTEKARVARSLAEQTGREEHEFKGKVLLQCDRALPYSLVRDVMITAGRAEFREFKFVVSKRD